MFIYLFIYLLVWSMPCSPPNKTLVIQSDACLQAHDRSIEALHRTLIHPSPTRWNSKYDSIKLFLKLQNSHTDGMDRLCNHYHLIPFTYLELSALTDYIRVSSRAHLWALHTIRYWSNACDDIAISSQ